MEAIWLLSGQVRESESVREIPISIIPFQVGRRSDLTFCLPSPTVSNVHAELNVRDGDLFVRDLNSTNGTFVNGRRVEDEEILQEGDLVQFANAVFRVKRHDTVIGSETLAGENYDRALALIQFDRLISDRAIVPFFQPIVAATDHALYGYEVVGRSHLFGLNEPSSMFQAAAQLNLESELSRLCRWVGMEAGSVIEGLPPVFLNTHPVEMTDTAVIELSLQELREAHSQQPITLEIHESVVADAATMRRMRAILKALDIKLAYDDFGAGQARLIELVEVPPDYLKFDIRLIRGIDRGSPQRQHMLASLVRMVGEMGIQAVAEGVETIGEAEACAQFGFNLGQGFFYGRPAPVGSLVTK